MDSVLLDIEIIKKRKSALEVVAQVPFHKRNRIRHATRHYTIQFIGDMFDIGMHTTMLEPSTCWSICQRWRCIRVARIARIKT
jgi:hypothetical protein